MYELLDYRVDSAKNIVEKYGINLGSGNIKGTPFIKLNYIKLRLDEEEDSKLDNGSKRKKDNGIIIAKLYQKFSLIISNNHLDCDTIENY